MNGAYSSGVVVLLISPKVCALWLLPHPTIQQALCPDFQADTVGWAQTLGTELARTNWQNSKKCIVWRSQLCPNPLLILQALPNLQAASSSEEQIS